MFVWWSGCLSFVFFDNSQERLTEVYAGDELLAEISSLSEELHHWFVQSHADGELSPLLSSNWTALGTSPPLRVMQEKYSIRYD